jgi:hypothetical protein
VVPEPVAAAAAGGLGPSAPLQSAAMDAATTPLPDIVLWRSDRCHLCEDTESIVEGLLAERAADGLPIPHLVPRRIAEDPVVERALFEQIPVLEVAGCRLPLAIRPDSIRAFLHESYGW